jgi:hypothetical protein
MNMKTSDKRKKAVRFGDVVVHVVPPTATELRKRIADSERVARALANVLARPGIRLRVPAGTPLYRADPRHSELVIRQIRGKTTRGTFRNGKFVAVDPNKASKPKGMQA